jgi:hypothetical protein
MHPGRPRLPHIVRLTRKTKFIPEGCWEWNGNKTRHGYGRIVIVNDEGKREHWTTHRLAYKHFHPEWDEDGYILHSCDNPCCWNPDHIRVGTQYDNIHDMISRGRRVLPPPPKGERNPRAKLKEKQVYEILRLLKAGSKMRPLARQFSVDRRTIKFILAGNTWAHLRRD